MKGLVFTYLLTIGGPLASLISPFYGLLVYVCFAIISPEALWPWSVPQGNYSRIVAVGMLLGWLIHCGGSWKLGQGKWPTLAFLGLFSWLVLGALLCEQPPVAWEYVNAMSKILIPFVVGITTIDSTAKLRALIWVIVVSQGYVALEMNLYYLGGYNMLKEQGFAGMDNNSATIALVSTIGLAFFLGLQTRSLWQKGIAWGFAACLTHAVLFSFSRGGMVALLVTGIVAFILIPKQPRHYLAFALASVLVFASAGPEVRARFLTSFGSEEGQMEASAQSRLDLWADCWDVMLKNPIMGAGPDHWPLRAHEYGWPAGKEAHSLWMQAGAELGFVGVGLFLGFYASVIWLCWQVVRTSGASDDPVFADVSRMVIASTVGFVVSAQFVSLETLELPYYVVLLGAGSLKLRSLLTDKVEQATAETDAMQTRQTVIGPRWVIPGHPLWKHLEKDLRGIG